MLFWDSIYKVIYKEKNLENPFQVRCEIFRRFTCLIFKFVSPSKFEVSKKHMELGSLEHRKSKSAGKNSLDSTRTILPTFTSFHFLSFHSFDFNTIMWYCCYLIEVFLLRVCFFTFCFLIIYLNVGPFTTLRMTLKLIHI